jgi:hypothetical protein
LITANLKYETRAKEYTSKIKGAEDLVTKAQAEYDAVRTEGGVRDTKGSKEKSKSKSIFSLSKVCWS